MAAMRILPRLDEVENGGLGFELRTESVPNEQLAFERGVETFTHRIDRSSHHANPSMVECLQTRNVARRR